MNVSKPATVTPRLSKGKIVHTLVTLDASQARRFDEARTRLGMNKRKAFAQAINIWLSSISAEVKVVN